MTTNKHLQKLITSFRHAFAGISYVLRTQRNAKIHFGITLVVVLVSILLQISISSWGLIIVAIALVWVAEGFNTALEAALDTFELEYHPLIKIGKDVGAAAVLFAAIAAVLIGLLVLGPPLLSQLTQFIGL